MRARAADGPVHRHRRLDRPRGAHGRRALARPARRPRRRGPPRARPLRRPRGQDDRRRASSSTFDGAPSHAVRCARGDRRARSRALGPRACASGLHTGECELIGDDVGGMAVHIAARVAALAAPGRGARLGDDVRHGRRRRACDSRTAARRQLAGVPGRWPLFALADAASDRSRPCRPQPSAAAALLGCSGTADTDQRRHPDASRIRKALHVARHGPWILASALLVALLVAPFAVAAGEGNAAARRRAQPVAERVAGATPSETQIIANIEHLRHAPVQQVRQRRRRDLRLPLGAGGTAKGNEPCVRASNLADGRAFEFAPTAAPRSAASRSATRTPRRSRRTPPAWPPA